MLLGLVILGSRGGAAAKETITMAHFFDKGYDAVYPAIASGKVKSDLVDLKLTGLDISALIQATGSRQFDIAETSILGAVRARQRGLDVKIIMGGLTATGGQILFTKKGSPITKPEQLKGKTVAVFSLGSTSVAQMQLLLWKKNGLNISKGGDIRCQEIPITTIGTTLLKDRVDAGFTLQSFARKVLDSGEYQVLQDTVPEFRDFFQVKFMPSVYITYDSVLAKKAKLIEVEQRLSYESSKYSREHAQEVAQELAKLNDRPA